MTSNPKITQRQDTEYYMGYKRDSKHRIFVNKSLQLGKINFFGFDMDYTLAMYKSPELEIMSFDLLKHRMVQIGYPTEFDNFQYDPSFPIRGLWVDRKFGNLLKMDNYGNVLMCFHGFQRMSNSEIVKYYPNKFVKFEQPRIFVTNTLYNLPETYLLAATIDYFENNKDYRRSESGISVSDNITISYSSIIEDIRDAMEFVHEGREMDDNVLNNLDKYVERSHIMPEMLLRLKSNGAKTFLLTNSDFKYTEKICRYILYCDEKGTDWHTFFDYIVTSSRKPRFFFEGSLLRVINKTTGKPEIGHLTGPMKTGSVYSGGSVETFSALIGAIGKDVLYFGDHIFGDIMKSKKVVGWKTCLIVPEIENEIFVWKYKGELFEQMQNVNVELAESYRNLDLGSTVLPPDVHRLRDNVHDLARKMEDSYGIFGSLFRSGSRQTFFAGQVQQYADLYTSSCLNLLFYPLTYMFQAPFMLMPHESTVSHVESNDMAEYGVDPGSLGDQFGVEELPPIGLRRRSMEISGSIVKHNSVSQDPVKSIVEVDES